MHQYNHINKPTEMGFSIIEFMIAIAISMVILLAVSVAWQYSYATQQSQADVSRLNETVRFSMDLLSREIRQAGLINTVNSSVTEPKFCSTSAVGGIISGVNDPATINPTTAGVSFTGTTVTISNLSDAIRVRYYGEDTATGTSASLDCLGNAVPIGSLVEDTLYVAPDPANKGEPALWCRSSNGPMSAPMVSGVESLQLLYGEDTDGDGIINYYVPWQLVTNSDHVLSVKVSIIARSENAVSAGITASKKYYHFGATYIDPGGTSGTLFTDPGDKRLRLPQPLSSEIALRNFGNCS
jgi:type IV pilus assembly protein PilW